MSNKFQSKFSLVFVKNVKRKEQHLARIQSPNELGILDLICKFSVFNWVTNRQNF